MARTTIRDIARESGYSIGTVSRALNNQPGVSSSAREAILKVVEEYGFELNPNAKFLKQRVPEGIVILIRGSNNMLFAELLEKIQHYCQKKGYNTSVYYIDETSDEVIEAIKVISQRSPRGLLFLGSTREHFRRSFRQIHIPSIMVTNSAEGLPFENLSSVSTNDAAAAQFTLEYLFSLGHERIGVLGGFLSDSQAAKSRYQGVQFAYYNRQKTFDPNLQYVSDYFSIDGGYRAMDELLDKMPDLTAVYAMSDVMALGAVRCLADHGKKVPEEISIIGNDGIMLTAYTIPRLTTIRQDTDQLAKRSVDLLLEQIENPGNPVYEETQFYLLQGESVSAPGSNSN